RARQGGFGSLAVGADLVDEVRELGQEERRFGGGDEKPVIASPEDESRLSVGQEERAHAERMRGDPHAAPPPETPPRSGPASFEAAGASGAKPDRVDEEARTSAPGAGGWHLLHVTFPVPVQNSVPRHA